MASIRQATLTLRVDSTRASQDLKRFIGVTDLLHTSSTRATSTLGRLQNQILRLVGAYAGLSVIRQSVRDFADFEKQLAMVHTMLYQGNSQILPQYAKQLRVLSIAMGEDTATLAKGLYDVLSAAIPASEAMKLLETTSKAAVGGMTTTAKATDAVISVLKSYNLGTEYAAKVSSDLFEVVQRGEITFEELAHNIGHVAPIAAQAGVSLEELLAFIATTTRAGLRAELAVTAVKNAISEFIKPSREGALLAKELGFALESATIQSMGLRGVFDLLKNQSPEVLATLFADIRGVNAVMATLGQFEDFLFDFDFISNTSRSHLDAYNKVADTTAKKFERFWMAIKDVRRALGETLAPALVDVTGKITQWVQDDPEKFRRYGELLSIEIGRWKDLFVAFANYLRSDFSAAMEVAMKVVVAGMELAGRAMIDLSGRIGKGVMEELKENIFGGRENEIQKEAWGIYVGQKHPTRTRRIQQIASSVNGWSNTKDMVEPALPDVYRQIEEQVRYRKMTEAQDRVLQGFDVRLQQMVSDARRKMTAAVGSPGDGPDTDGPFSEYELLNLERLFGVPSLTEPGLGPRIGTATSPRTVFARRATEINAARDAQRKKVQEKYAWEKAKQDFWKIWTEPLEGPIQWVKDRIEEAKEYQIERSQTYGRRLAGQMTQDDIDRMRARHRLTLEVKEHIEAIQFETKAMAMSRQEAEKATEVFRLQQRAQEDGIELDEKYTTYLKAEIEILQKTEKLRRVGDEIGRGFARGFADAAMSAHNLKDALRSLENAAMGVMEIMLWEPMAQSLSTGFMKLFPTPVPPTGVTTVPAGDLGPAMQYHAAHGRLFRGGRIIPFAAGGIIDRPMTFPLAGGMGLAGENGPEWAIAPLKRMPSGNLGVETTGSKPSVNAEIHLHNESGTPLAGEMSDIRFDGQRALIGMVLKDKRNNGPISRASRRR